jgi:hypothetical protein
VTAASAVLAVAAREIGYHEAPAGRTSTAPPTAWTGWRGAPSSPGGASPRPGPPPSSPRAPTPRPPPPGTSRRAAPTAPPAPGTWCSTTGPGTAWTASSTSASWRDPQRLHHPDHRGQHHLRLRRQPVRRRVGRPPHPLQSAVVLFGHPAYDDAPATPPPALDGSSLATLSYGMRNDSRVAAFQRQSNAFPWAPELPVVPATGNYLARRRTSCAARGAVASYHFTDARASARAVALTSPTLPLRARRVPVRGALRRRLGTGEVPLADIVRAPTRSGRRSPVRR